MKKIKCYFFLLMGVLLLVGCHKENKLPEKTFSFEVNEQNLTTHLEFVTSDDVQGRLVGSAGNNDVMDYIKTKFEEYGLASPSSLEDYKQNYSQKVRKINKEPHLSLIDSSKNIIKEYQFIDDFGLLTYIPNSKIVGDITAQTFKFSDTKASSAFVKNHFGLITLNELYRAGGVSALNDYTDSVGFIIRNDNLGSQNQPYDYIPDGPNVTESESINNNNGKMNIMVTPTVYDEIFKETGRGASIHLSMDNSIDWVNTGNMVGYVQGKDANHYVLVTAHLDHIGSFGSSYNPGALDNGSGLSALLEIARVISKNKEYLDQTVVFVAFNGEEEGLYGSNYYVDDPVFSLSASKVINLDMVGSAADFPLSIDYCSASRGLSTNLGNLANKEGFIVQKDENTSSDHGPFCDAGYPAVTLINMDLEDGYHSPNDTIDDVDVKKLEKIVRLVADYIDQYE